MAADPISSDHSDLLTTMNQNQNQNPVFPECNDNPADRHTFFAPLNLTRVDLTFSDHSELQILANIFSGHLNLDQILVCTFSDLLNLADKILGSIF